ncbi:GreA/GreB family elongation factor [Pinibacter aurantiacus]|uniref:GreA/GreB family elongation factor n=1 Tax=Pinibacter aurantiacus TaxID=2851599 RepID=A0A9E2W7X7_9BACT|nr:GreA/GreB family elongation factor [Pinibacter aurantiacus]MBV4357436.1 GreA/GreB family elongation factor [Pinibacter aurantiacus]
MTLKEQVYNQCVNIVSQRITDVQKTLDDLRESIANETKSTAGDKYETARAMLHIEQENVTKQMTDLLEQKAQLEKLSMIEASDTVIKGSLVKTDRGYLFLSIALGKIKLSDQTVVALSPQSPLGKQLMGLRVGESTLMNGTKYAVEGIE